MTFVKFKDYKSEKKLRQAHKNYWADGKKECFYEGEFNKGIYEGSGKLKLFDIVYEGAFKDGL